MGISVSAHTGSCALCVQCAAERPNWVQNYVSISPAWLITQTTILIVNNSYICGSHSSIHLHLLLHRAALITAQPVLCACCLSPVWDEGIRSELDLGAEILWKKVLLGEYVPWGRKKGLPDSSVEFWVAFLEMEFNPFSGHKGDRIVLVAGF